MKIKAAVGFLERMLDITGVEPSNADLFAVWSVFRFFLHKNVDGCYDQWFLVEWGDELTDGEPSYYLNFVKVCGFEEAGEHDHSEEVRIDLHCSPFANMPAPSCFFGPGPSKNLHDAIFDLERTSEFAQLMRSSTSWKLEVLHEWR